MIPDKIGPYEIVSTLGEGGMGAVYLAQDTRLQRRVALKILSDNLTARPKVLARFQQEARLASSLNHPGVVHIYETGELEGLHFIAMEFVEGETLAMRMNHAKLSVSEAIICALKIAEVLRVAHSQGIVHRDLKPGNIMITTSGNVKILDFGVAKREMLADDSESPTGVQTETGVVVGTTHYMSPEQVLGAPVDHRSDLFSFGSLLYEMVTGVRPFQAPTLRAVITRIIHDSPENPSKLVPAIPDDLDYVILKCLRKSVDDRYQTARDLMSDLNVIRRKMEGEESLVVLRREPEYRIPRNLGRILFLATQFLYVGMYLAALYWAVPMQSGFAELLGESVATPLMVLYLITALIGFAMRLHFVALVTWDHVTTGIQFRKLFPVFFALDIIWAFAPLSLSRSLNAIFLLACIPPLAFLPFGQRTLIRSTYDTKFPRRLNTT